MYLNAKSLYFYLKGRGFVQNITVINGMLGFAAGIMIAVSFGSLLEPTIELADQLGQVACLTAA